MEILKCTECGEIAYTDKEFISGRCRWCCGKLKKEKNYSGIMRNKYENTRT